MKTANRFGGNKIGYLSALIVTGGLLCSIFLESRSFFFGFAVTGCYLAVASPMFRRWKWLPRASLGLLVGLLCFLTFSVKSDSSKGRMFIYKVSSVMFVDHYLSGVGRGCFETDYLSYQAAYFRNGDYTEQEMLLADNTYFAFNDYWQFIIEYGLVGMLILVAMGVLLVITIVRLPSSKKRLPLYSFSVITLVVISVAACFNHLFEKLAVQLIFFGSIMVLGWGHLSERKKIRSIYSVGGFLLMALLIYQTYGHRLTHQQAYHHWEISQTINRAGFVTESLQHCEIAARSLASDGRFMEYYGRQLVRARRYLEAIVVLNRALDNRQHHRIYLDLGTSYQETGRMEDAEQAFLTAVYMVPNRFENRFALFEYYRVSDRIADALYWGSSILDLPIKIPSRRVDQIREQVTKRMQKLRELEKICKIKEN